jgi:hypothetical protein
MSNKKVEKEFLKMIKIKEMVDKKKQRESL